MQFAVYDHTPIPVCLLSPSFNKLLWPSWSNDTHWLAPVKYMAFCLECLLFMPTNLLYTRSNFMSLPAHIADLCSFRRLLPERMFVTFSAITCSFPATVCEVTECSAPLVTLFPKTLPFISNSAYVVYTCHVPVSRPGMIIPFQNDCKCEVPTMLCLIFHFPTSGLSGSNSGRQAGPRSAVLRSVSCGCLHHGFPGFRFQSHSAGRVPTEPFQN